MMMFLRAWWRRIVLAAVVVLVAIQFIPSGVNDPTTRDEPTWDSARTRSLVMRACADCHSNETHVLWFEHVAPIKWYITDHVTEGRSALNFSEWHMAAGHGAREAAGPLRHGSMPPSYYTYFGLHGASKLTATERQQLIDGLEKTIAADPPIGGHS